MLNLNYILNNVLKNSGEVCRNCTIKVTVTPTRYASQTTKLSYGQPTHESHPYLIQKDEVTPLTQVKEYQNRRKCLLENIVQYSQTRKDEIKTHLVVVPAATKKFMSDKIPYTFRQNSDFLYLTGCLEPDSCLIISTDNNWKSFLSVMFMREKDTHSELWDGPRTGPRQALSLFGVDRSLPINDLRSYINSCTERKDCLLWYDLLNPVQYSIHNILEEYVKNGSVEWESPIPVFHKLRLLKSNSEIALMQKTCDIASQAIVETIKKSRPLMNEHELYATVDYQCRISGANFLAYPPVIAGGNRANIIHYINNNQIIKPNETVLMDAGCEYFGYVSDITRTWPISGTFTPQQREIYELVLSVQKQLISLCRDFPSLDALFHRMTEMLGKGLQEIGLINKSLSGESLLKRTYEFCPHHVSHYLGMDVHDTPSVPRNIKILPGMVITIEPGIYVNERLNAPKDYVGIGIRIEDDVLITEDGPIILTQKCPKEIPDIEKIASEMLN